MITAEYSPQLTTTHALPNDKSMYYLQDITYSTHMYASWNTVKSYTIFQHTVYITDQLINNLNNNHNDCNSQQTADKHISKCFL